MSIISGRHASTSRERSENRIMNNLQRPEINGCFISPFRSSLNVYLHSDLRELVVGIVVR
jgi:hypothetical protein